MTVKDAYVNSIIRQRGEREEKMLASPFNWLSLVGLFPLQNGVNAVGNGAQYRINLPCLPAGESASFIVRDDGVFLSTSGSRFLLNGQPPTARPLRTDVDEDPDLVQAGTVAMRVIRRNNLPFLRVWDQDAPALKSHRGLRYFPVDPQYWIIAYYRAYETPRSILIMDAIGGEHESFFPGEAHFRLEGVDCVLIAEEDGGELLFNFTDLTRTDTTYPGGRYLVTEPPRDGRLILDFNLTRNWPCAYTAFATCPLPPPENHLKVRIEAGEMRYHN